MEKRDPLSYITNTVVADDLAKLNLVAKIFTKLSHNIPF